ncbi:AraC family transcriptional regulator [uncultured Tateyamaria sp.]|uniref:AraC family transcriptional regulator n=1 Tax=uncultured Tateyamaria sp. TaxID=455651 RepID=UPI002636A09E|nr:AraC family transcriptional regulator [uncultured Tateyamaria sp.]
MAKPEDALSEVLRLVHLRACIYFIRDMAAPWGMDIPAVANGPLHMVLDGSCVLKVGDRQISLQAGDAVLLPSGAQHQMLDALDTPAEPGPEVMQRLLDEDYGPQETSATRMMCGHFEWDISFEHPLFQELPEVMIIRDVFSGKDASRIRAIVDLIGSESKDMRPGSSAIADRMGEVLFVSFLRHWLVENNPNEGVLAVIDDARLSRALHQIHDAPEADLTLNVLARTAGMSRTSFAVQFRAAMGIPPAEYLAGWRLLKARNLLRRTDLTTSEICSRVGYGSDAAFSRAFKRQFGVPPSKIRNQA